MLQAKIITAGPRGNECRKCMRIVKAPEVVLIVTGEVDKFTKFAPVDKFCPKCGLGKLIEAEARLKQLKGILTNGPADESQLGTRKVKVV